MIQHLNKLADDEEASQLLDIQDEDIAGGNEEDQPREEEDQIREGSDERQLTPSIDPWVAQQIPDTVNWIQATTDTFNKLFPAAFETAYRDWETDRKSTRLNSSHRSLSRMPSSA